MLWIVYTLTWFFQLSSPRLNSPKEKPKTSNYFLPKPFINLLHLFKDAVDDAAQEEEHDVEFEEVDLVEKGRVSGLKFVVIYFMGQIS